MSIIMFTIGDKGCSEKSYPSPPLLWHEQWSFSLTWILSWIIFYTENLDWQCSGLSLNATGRLCLKLPFPSPPHRGEIGFHGTLYPSLMALNIKGTVELLLRLSVSFWPPPFKVAPGGCFPCLVCSLLDPKFLGHLVKEQNVCSSVCGPAEAMGCGLCNCAYGHAAWEHGWSFPQSVRTP